MKKIQIIVGLFIILGLKNYTAAQGITDSMALRLEFQQHAEKWKNAYNSQDARNLFPFYAEDARYISGHVPGLEAVGREKLLANFQKGMSGGGHVDSINIISINASPALVVLLTFYQATNSGSTVKGRNLLVLRKQDGIWLIVLHMTVV